MTHKRGWKYKLNDFLSKHQIRYSVVKLPEFRSIGVAIKQAHIEMEWEKRPNCIVLVNLGFGLLQLGVLNLSISISLS